MGDAVTLKYHIAGSPDISVAWFKAGGKLRKSPICSMDFSNGIATLKLIKTTKSDEGEYTCKAENRAGSDSASCSVRVKGDSRILYFFFPAQKMLSMLLCSIRFLFSETLFNIQYQNIRGYVLKKKENFVAVNTNMSFLNSYKDT